MKNIKANLNKPVVGTKVVALYCGRPISFNFGAVGVITSVGRKWAVVTGPTGKTCKVTWIEDEMMQYTTDPKVMAAAVEFARRG